MKQLPSANANTISPEILRLLQEESLARFPAFPEVFGKLKPMPKSGISSPLGTDGFHLFYEPELLCRTFLDSSDRLRSIYLHVHLHCLCFHITQDYECDASLRSESCDLAAAMTAALLVNSPDGKKLLDRLGQLAKALTIPINLLLDTSRSIPLLKAHPELRRLAVSCALDTHQFWPLAEEHASEKQSANCGGTGAKCRARSASQKQQLEALQLLWGTLQQKFQRELSNGLGKRGSAPGGGTENASLRKKDSIDYRRFLHRFTVPGEEAVLDQNSFDYIPYHYGLTYYNNMPFIEPLEYQEVNRLDELAIAIDTSGSCSGRIVRRFLEETWNILRQRENFFSRMRLHLIQCDSMIQEHRIFTSAEEWEASLSNIKILGQGNTDFRPVFEYLDALIAKKEIRHLRGLLYFTDGDGIYPRVRPAYDTAFVFLNDSTEKQKIPDWAIRLNLHLPDDF